MSKSALDGRCAKSSMELLSRTLAVTDWVTLPFEYTSRNKAVLAETWSWKTVLSGYASLNEASLQHQRIPDNISYAGTLEKLQML